jgi:hypothetical protein
VPIEVGENDPYPGQVSRGGCTYDLPTSGNPDLGNGNNCHQLSNGNLMCYHNATPTGAEAPECVPGEPCIPVVAIPEEQPIPTRPPETETQTQATPTGGTTSTSTEKTQQVAPNGVVEDKEVTTTTRTEGGVTTTEVTTITTVRQPDGSTSTTNQTTVTDAEGNTTIVASGNSSTPAKGTTSTEEVQDEREEEQVGGSYSGGTCTADTMIPGECESSMDVVQCGIYQEQWKARCLAELQNEKVFGNLSQLQSADSVIGEGTANQVVEEQRNFSNAVSSVIDDEEFNFGSSCPAGVSVSILGFSYELSYQWVCDMATGIRAVVIALGYVFATIIVIRSLGQQV